MAKRARRLAGGRCWQQWTESEARSALAEMSGSGTSLAQFARDRRLAAADLLLAEAPEGDSARVRCR